MSTIRMQLPSAPAEKVSALNGGFESFA